MHESTHRLLCQLAFVAGCATPTLLVLSWIAATWTPWYADWQRRSAAAELSAMLGMKVSVEHFERPAPGTWKLRGIAITERETEAEVGRIRLAIYSQQNEKRVLQLHQPELQSAQLRHAWRLMHDRFLCQPSLTAQPMVVTARSLTLHSGAGGVTMRDAIARVVPKGDQLETSLELLPAGSESDRPIWIGVTRDRRDRLPKTHWRLHTGGAALPCSALVDYLPQLRPLGNQAHFSGAMAWQISTEGWSLDLKGATFHDVELSELFDGLPHKMSGLATIRLDRCQIEPGEAVDLSGSLVAEGGYIGSSLLQTARQHLGVTLTNAAPAVPTAANPRADSGPRGSQWYDLLSFRFDLFDTQLRLTGTCNHRRGFEALPMGVLVASGSQSLAVRVSDEALPATNLVSALAPPHAAMVPYSRQTAGLRHLLVPPRRPVTSDTLPAVPRITFRPNEP